VNNSVSIKMMFDKYYYDVLTKKKKAKEVGLVRKDKNPAE